MIRPSRSGTVPLALAATLLAGCDNPSSAPAPALGDPVAGLDAGAQGRFLLGRALFERLATPDEGLGPLFNAERCSDCHDQPVTGGGGIRIRVVRATRFAEGRCDLLEAEGGDNIQQRATDLLAAHDLGPERIPPSATATARVTAPALFGLGLIDAIPDAVLLEAADPDDRDGDGISGRLPRLPDGRSARFGRKGDAHGLQDFVISALRFELGFTTPSQPDEIAVNGHPVPPAADPARDPEIDAVALGQLTDYMRFLAPPAPADLPSATARDSVARGEAIFRQIGCISCHRQEMRTARFIVLNIPPGTHSLRASFIGYGPVTQEFTVTVGGTAEVNFDLAQSALALDEIVVTATGQQRKRELGNAVGDINAAEIREVAPVNNISDLLQGRSAGVQVFNSAGTSGVGSRIRIRGSSSISLSNDPLIYVDGIRVDSRQSGLGAGGQEASRLDDFNPEDIESIEIVKGPSAATLYGTEAANGVIRITTKRGIPGTTRWNIWAEGGIIQEPNQYPLNFTGLDASGGTYARACRLNEVAQGLCNQSSIESYQVLHDPMLSPIDDGSRNQFGVSVSGGTERIKYYIAGEFEGETGPFSLPQPDREDLEARGVPITSEVERPNQLQRRNLRINLNSQVADQVTLALQMSYLDSHFAYMGNDNNSFGFMPSAFFGGSNPDRAWGFQRPAQLFGRTFYQDTNRMTASSTATWNPFEWLSMRGTGGLDYYNRNDISFFARDIGVPGDSNRGRKDTDYINQWQYTFDASATASFDLTNWITSRTALGVQYFENRFQGTNAWGIDIVNGGSSIGLAAETFSDEFHTFEKTAGLFIDQQIGLNDRLFLTGAIRADDNSAFGQDFDLIYYPKAGLSWIASEEDFFPEIPFLDQFRLRGAWGKSGLQPGSDDAIRTLSATAITTPSDETGSGVSIGNIGNSLLEPERSSEVEVGFDAEIAGGRAGIEFTYYDKRTDGALITVPLAPSLGASASR